MLLVAFLAQSGLVPPALVLISVAGANAGGVLAPVWTTLAHGITARRLTLANVLVRVAGALALMLFAGPLAAFMLNWVAPDHLTFATHLAFNILLLIIFLPMTGPLAILMQRALPDQPDANVVPSHLDPTSLTTPSLALAGAAREALRMGDDVRQMLQSNLLALQQDIPDGRAIIANLDNAVDARLTAIKLFLARLRGMTLVESEAQRCTEVMSYAINMEHIGDIIDHYLSDIGQKRMQRRLRFSDAGMVELTAFYATTLDNLALSQSVLLTRDVALARRLMAQKVAVRRMEEESSAKHLDRITRQEPGTIDTSSLHLDILRDLKRINAHLASAAYPILEEIGALRESRVKGG